jgi:hypothetical protein
VPCVLVGQRAVSRVQYGIEEGNEFAGRRIRSTCGGDAFPGDIADAYPQARIIQANHVEIIAADGARGLPGSHKLNSGQLRQRLWQ